MTVIERVAQAIATTIVTNDQGGKGSVERIVRFVADLQNIEWNQSEFDSQVQQIARAAIEAMRDPGHDITAAVVSPGDDRTQVVAMWNAMIDAALSEHKD